MIGSIVSRLLPVATTAMLLSACMTSNLGSFRPLDRSYPPKAKDCPIEVLRSEKPTQDYIEVSRLNVHIERTTWIPADYASAEIELKKQACLSGADAIIDVKEQTSSTALETRIYNVSGIGIRYLGPQP